MAYGRPMNDPCKDEYPTAPYFPVSAKRTSSLENESTVMVVWASSCSRSALGILLSLQISTEARAETSHYT